MTDSTVSKGIVWEKLWAVLVTWIGSVDWGWLAGWWMVWRFFVLQRLLFGRTCTQ